MRNSQPPHALWSCAQSLSLFRCQSHYRVRVAVINTHLLPHIYIHSKTNLILGGFLVRVVGVRRGNPQDCRSEKGNPAGSCSQRRAPGLASKLRFFSCLAGAMAHGSTVSSEHVSTHTELPQPTPPAVDPVDAPSPSVNVQSLPSLPNIKDRKEDTIYLPVFRTRT